MSFLRVLRATSPQKVNAPPARPRGAELREAVRGGGERAGGGAWLPCRCVS